MKSRITFLFRLTSKMANRTSILNPDYHSNRMRPQGVQSPCDVGAKTCKSQTHAVRVIMLSFGRKSLQKQSENSCTDRVRVFVKNPTHSDSGLPELDDCKSNAPLLLASLRPQTSTPFLIKVFGERIFMSVNNCVVIELHIFLRGVVPTINNHKQAVVDVISRPMCLIA